MLRCRREGCKTYLTCGLPVSTHMPPRCWWGTSCDGTRPDEVGFVAPCAERQVRRRQAKAARQAAPASRIA